MEKMNELHDPLHHGIRRQIRTELDEVADGSHHDEAHADGLADLDEFALVGCLRCVC